MPIYEYRCERGHTFEVMQRMTEDPLDSCSTCGAPVQRVFHPVAVHFKGSGFYNTDYGKQKTGVADSKGSDSKGSDSKGSDSKGSDSKGSDSKESKSSEAKSSDSGSSSSASSASSSSD